MEIDKENLLEPYIELNTEYYDLGLENRDKTEDQLPLTLPGLFRNMVLE